MKREREEQTTQRIVNDRNIRAMRRYMSIRAWDRLERETRAIHFANLQTIRPDTAPGRNVHFK